MRIAHLSDVHFGRIDIPTIVDGLVHEVNTVKPDLVVVSGDLTQRARRKQFTAAREMLDAFTSPLIVVPGNHDVHAWWRPHKRLLRPLERFKHYITPDLLPTFSNESVAVLGINSAHGKTIMGGRISKTSCRRIHDYFIEQEPSRFKVLVVHHHLTRIQALGPHDVARRARRALLTAASVGVDLILCGHLHISHIEPTIVAPMGARVVIASAGTATSNRGRMQHRQTNFYNMIEVRSNTFSIEERRYDRLSGVFVKHSTRTFDRVFQEVPVPLPFAS